MQTGYNELDKIIEINKGDLIIVAARPAMGKTSFVSNVANYVLNKENETVLFLGLEELKEKIEKRIIVANENIEIEKIDSFIQHNDTELKLSKDDVNRIIHGINYFEDLPIYIYQYEEGAHIDTVCSVIKNLNKERNLGLIIIDYFQCIRCNSKLLPNREDEITEILRRLKLLAEELNVPIIITSQLPRKIEKRDDKRPLIEDFTSSPKRINYYVDKVLFIYRDSYYNKNNKSNLTEIIVANNKNGKTGTVELERIPKYLKFVNTKLNRS